MHRPSRGMCCPPTVQLTIGAGLGTCAQLLTCRVRVSHVTRLADNKMPLLPISTATASKDVSLDEHKHRAIIRRSCDEIEQREQ